MELGYDSIEKLKEAEKPGQLHQQMIGCKKKNKLEISTVTMDQVTEWISNYTRSTWSTLSTFSTFSTFL